MRSKGTGGTPELLSGALAEAADVIVVFIRYDDSGGSMMRTTISIPDEVYSEARQIMGARPFSEFASEAIHTRVQQLKRDRLAWEMAEGYRVEAESPSLDPAWNEVETEGL